MLNNMDPLTLALLGIGTLAGAYTGYQSIRSQREANAMNVALSQDTNVKNLAIARETNENQYRMFKEQIGENRYLQQQTMAYNSAAAQAQRIRQAGLNPALAMYQGVNAGSLSGFSAPAAPALHAPVMEAPHVAPVDYAPISSAFSNSVSLLKELPDIQEALGKLPGAKESAKSLQTSAVKLASQQVKNAEVENEKATVQKHILEQQFIKEQYEADLATFKRDAFIGWNTSLSNKDRVAFYQFFGDSFRSELQEAIDKHLSSSKNRQLTDKQIQALVEEVAQKKLQTEKEKFSKEGYEFINQQIDKLPPLLRGVVRSMSIVATQFMKR